MLKINSIYLLDKEENVLYTWDFSRDYDVDKAEKLLEKYKPYCVDISGVKIYPRMHYLVMRILKEELSDYLWMG